MKLTDKKERTPPNTGEALQFWINGFPKPIIGEIVSVVVLERKDGDDVYFVINSDQGEITVNADSVTATGMASEAA